MDQDYRAHDSWNVGIFPSVTAVILIPEAVCVDCSNRIRLPTSDMWGKSGLYVKIAGFLRVLPDQPDKTVEAAHGGLYGMAVFLPVVGFNARAVREYCLKLGLGALMY